MRDGAYMPGGVCGLPLTTTIMSTMEVYYAERSICTLTTLDPGLKVIDIRLRAITVLKEHLENAWPKVQSQRLENVAERVLLILNTEGMPVGSTELHRRLIHSIIEGGSLVLEDNDVTLRDLGCKNQAYLRAFIGAPFLPAIPSSVKRLNPFVLSEPLREAVYNEIVPAETEALNKKILNQNSKIQAALLKTKTQKNKIEELEKLPDDMPPWAKVMQEEIKKMNDKITKQDKVIERQNMENQRQNTEIQRLNTEIQRLNMEIQRLNTENVELKTENATLKHKIRSLETEVTTLVDLCNDSGDWVISGVRFSFSLLQH